MLNKDDYNKFAFNFIKLTNTNNYSYAECDTILQGLMKLLEFDNPKFDKSKFLKKVNGIRRSKVKDNESDILEKELEAISEEISILYGRIFQKQKLYIQKKVKLLKVRMGDSRKTALTNAKHTTKTDEIW